LIYVTGLSRHNQPLRMFGATLALGPAFIAIVVVVALAVSSD
jgi:hypothetical protein